MSGARCHRTENAKKRINEVLLLFPKRVLNDVPLINQIRNVSLTVFSNCITVWNNQHVEDLDAPTFGTDQIKRTKFVMPKNRDITVASCLICAIYSANDASFYPIFPLDVIRCMIPSTMEEGEFDKFKKRVFEFIAIIQENGLATTATNALIPTFDYGLLVTRVFNHALQALPIYGYRATLLFEKLVKEVQFDGRSPLFICLLVLYHYLHASECICCSDMMELDQDQRELLQTLIDNQIKNMRICTVTLLEVNTRLRVQHEMTAGRAR